MVPAGNKAKRLSSVNHTTKTIHHLHHRFLAANRQIAGIIQMIEQPDNISHQSEILRMNNWYYLWSFHIVGSVYIF